MTHILSMFDSEWLHHYDLPAKEVVVAIESCRQGELTNKGGRDKRPVLKFKGYDKALALNKTNAKTMIRLYGKVAEEYVGKKITLYQTTTSFGPDTVECIRIRPEKPK